MDQLIWVLAIVLAIIVGLAGFGALLYILRIAVRAVGRIAGLAAASLLSLIVFTAIDIRFLSLVVIIFTMLADHNGAGWPWIALVLSISLFLMSTSYLVVFWLEAINDDILEVFVTNDEQKHFLSKVLLVNIGFLGIIYIAFAFFATSYNYFLLSTETTWFRTNVFTGPTDVVSGDFIAFSFQKVLETIPFEFSKEFNISVSRISIPEGAYVLKAFVIVFKALFYGSFASLCMSLIKGRDLFAAPIDS